MEEIGPATMEVSQIQAERQQPAQEIEAAEDELAPLSPSLEFDAAAAYQDLDEINPFVFKPPFTTCDKLIVSSYQPSA